MVFRNISYFGEITERRQIRENIIWFLREQLLNMGAYYNITSGTLDYGGYDVSKLRPSYQPEYNNFQFWTGLSHQWIWESGIVPYYSGGSDPIQISGVYVDGNFVPSGSSGPYEHYIDYTRGGVVFSNPISSGTEVRCYRSERAAFVYPSDSNELRQINLQHLRFVENIPGSGIDAMPPEYKTFLPAIFVDVALNRTVPYELGSCSQFKYYTVTLDIAAEDIDRFDVLRDICINLECQSIRMFNLNDIDYPLDYLGRLNNNPKVRSELVRDHFWKVGKFKEKSSRDVQLPNIYPLKRGRVFLDFEVVL